MGHFQFFNSQKISPLKTVEIETFKQRAVPYWPANPTTDYLAIIYYNFTFREREAKVKLMNAVCLELLKNISTAAAAVDINRARDTAMINCMVAYIKYILKYKNTIFN